MRYRDETDFDHQRPLATGILLANVGSPSAPTRRALRPYLKRFLSDPRVIEDQGVLWWCVLNLVILNTRPKRSAELYRKIWLDEGSHFAHVDALDAFLGAARPFLAGR